MGRVLSAVFSVFSGFLGIAVIYVGIWIAGYLYALAIPEAYFDWFADKNLPALVFWLLDIPTQFFSFGLPALLAGIIISRLLKGGVASEHLRCYCGFSCIFYSVQLELFFR